MNKCNSSNVNVLFSFHSNEKEQEKFYSTHQVSVELAGIAAAGITLLFDVVLHLKTKIAKQCTILHMLSLQ